MQNRILLLAALLLLLALFWNTMLNTRGEGARMARRINAAYGYSLRPADFYAAGEWEQASIHGLFPGEDLSAAVEASLLSNLPSDIEQTGHIVLLLANCAEDRVITLFMLDDAMMLGFEQQRDADAVYPLGTSAKEVLP